jgi:GNAT superfamily N-acetyltransferase
LANSSRSAYLFAKELWRERGSHLQVAWPDHRQTIEDALRELPRGEEWPGLFELLLDRRGPANRVAIVSDRDGPVAVVNLRPTGDGSWEPVTQWMVPGFLFPVRAGCTFNALAALQMRVDVSWWRYPETLPIDPRIKNVKRKVKFQISCTEDFEAYWRESGNLSFIRKAEKRCKNFTLKVNPEGGAEWAIRSSDRKWRDEAASPCSALADRIEGAKFLEDCGLHKTFVLYDGDKRIAGNTVLIDRDCVVGHTMYRSPEYDRHGVGTYLIKQIFEWARQSGFRAVDAGGGYAYKDLWAPAGGYTHTFTVVPTAYAWKDRALRLARRVANGTIHRFRVSRVYGPEGR